VVNLTGILTLCHRFTISLVHTGIKQIELLACAVNTWTAMKSGCRKAIALCLEEKNEHLERTMSRSEPFEKVLLIERLDGSWANASHQPEATAARQRALHLHADPEVSIEDGATVPLYYENRIPEVQLTNEHFNRDLEELLDDAELDEAQQKKLEREFAREYHIITREERLNAIAEDVVTHFTGRGYCGKAMMVCIDKAIAVRMFEKVRERWRATIEHVKAGLQNAKGDAREALIARVRLMAETDMAVVVSQGQNEVEDLAAKGLNIKPHRERMLREDLAQKFKSADDPLRLVFVCAMWITGFNVPTCSTIYLDKPMNAHTLMQTIARANRVASGKESGLIVDYVGIFRALQNALAVYAKPTPGAGPSDPIVSKEALVGALRTALEETRGFCDAQGVELDAIAAISGFTRIGLIEDAMDRLLGSDTTKKQYLQSGLGARRDCSRPSCPTLLPTSWPRKRCWWLTWRQRSVPRPNSLTYRV
jgi:hypothetical protein